jgi:hypothetical protein
MPQQCTKPVAVFCFYKHPLKRRVYEKIHILCNCPQIININRTMAIDTAQLRQELHEMTGS